MVVDRYSLFAMITWVDSDELIGRDNEVNSEGFSSEIAELQTGPSVHFCFFVWDVVTSLGLKENTKDIRGGHSKSSWLILG